jgi:hypothetical protein
MYLQDVEFAGIDRINLASYRDKRRALVNAVMNFRVPYSKESFVIVCRHITCCRMTLFYGFVLGVK